MAVERGKDFLMSKDEICAYLGGIGEALFAKFLTLSMPVTCVDGRYYAHRENIDIWWKALTAKRRPQLESQSTIRDDPVK